MLKYKLNDIVDHFLYYSLVMIIIYLVGNLLEEKIIRVPNLNIAFLVLYLF